MIQSLCVFCGASRGTDPSYIDAAAAFGRLLAEHKIRMIYGGGNVGLMGAAASAAVSAGGEVIGVITEHLSQMEVGHLDISRLETVTTMHERKARMAELADGFVALPGGIGTLEELFEALTWTQLGIHPKPCALYNIEGFYTPLIELIDHLVETGFVKQAHADKLIVNHSPEGLLQSMHNYEHQTINKLTGEVVDQS